MTNSKIAEFLAKGNMYSTVDINSDDRKELNSLLNEKEKYTFDCFCYECNTYTTFNIYSFEEYWVEDKRPQIKMMGIALGGMSNTRPKNEEEKYQEILRLGNIICLTAHCVRGRAHPIWIFIKIDDDKITKIGQYPNVKFTLYPNADKYKKLLDEYYIELKTALLLHSNNVGVGSYVYLRRVFEKIIFNKYNEHKKTITISETEFFKLRMEDKIEILKEYLPDFIVKNKNIYSILSKGIHELNEDECLKYFNTIEQSIEMILDEIIEQKEKEEKQKSLTGLIANITGNLRKD